MADALPFLAASFDPTGVRYACIYQALDAHRLRVVPVTGDASPVEYVADKGVKFATLCWVQGAAREPTQAKKRKRASFSESDSTDYQIALGTNQGTILVYSPSTNRIVTVLGAAPSPGVCGISSKNGHLFSLQSDGSISDWDLAKGVLVSSGTSSVHDLRLLEPVDAGIVAASTSPYLFKDDIPAPSISFNGFATPVKQLALAQTDGTKFAAIAEEDRQLQTYSTNESKSLNSLMAPSNVLHVSVSSDDSVLAAASEDGKVYLFATPFTPSSTVQTPNKSRRKTVSVVKPLLSIHIQRPNGETVHIRQSHFADDFVTVVWAETGATPVFERVQWRKEGHIVDHDINIAKERATPKLSNHLVNGSDPAAAPVYNEVQVNVASGTHFANLDSDDDHEETLADRLDALGVSELSSGDDDDKSDDEESKASSSRTKKSDKLILSAPGSFAVLLNQALTMDDKQLLETCFGEKDEDLIKISIVKLEPQLAAKLLEKLAEKISRVQHRSAQLTVWIKWVMVAHGAYLATVPNLLKTLASLHTTLAGRIATLPRLRALQGRLELLDLQMDVRKEMAKSNREIEDDTEDVPEFVYNEDEFIVNGEEDLDRNGSVVEDEDVEIADFSDDEDSDLDDADGFESEEIVEEED